MWGVKRHGIFTVAQGAFPRMVRGVDDVNFDAEVVLPKQNFPESLFAQQILV